MSDRRDNGRAARLESRRKKRRRTLVRGLLKFVVWTLVLSAAFVFGVGYGRTGGEANENKGKESVTIEAERGAVTATLPTTTLVQTKTVVKVKTVKAKKSGGRKR